jgi:hypothetical protein
VARNHTRHYKSKLIRLVTDDFEDHTEDISPIEAEINRVSSEELLKRLTFHHRHGYGDYNITGE